MATIMDFLTISVCVYSYVTVLCVIGADAAVSTTDIKFLLDEQATLRHKLDTRIQTLRQRTANLNSTISKCIGLDGVTFKSSRLPKTTFNF